MQFQKIKINSDVTVIGAGMPGICAAIQCARLGMSVALVNNRGYLGGNASPEIRITVSGADGSSEFNYYARETGIMEELRLENLYRNPQGNVFLWHTVLLDYVLREKLIDVYLNTNIDSVEMDKNNIQFVSGSQSGSEKNFEFHSSYYIDDTGDGTIGYLAGGSFSMGRESKEEYGEKIAPDVADDNILLSTLSFYSKDTGRKSPYILPEFASNYDIKEALENREIPEKIPGDSRWEAYRMQWFYENGFGKNQINDNEQITMNHRNLIYNIWDHIKNSGKYDSENYDLEYVSPIPGKRESRRLKGDYVLTERDIAEQRQFEDCIAYGGWSIDLHAGKGFFSKDLINRHYFLNGVYEIPYRSCYSKDVDNLFMPSRCMSTTHVAFGSTRVMATLATIGQAVGVATYLCKEYNTNPRGVYKNHIKELQQSLINTDQYIIGQANSDLKDLAKEAKISTSSSQKSEIENYDRRTKLTVDTALIVPVKEKIDSILLLVKSSRKTNLKYYVYEPLKNQNYSPQSKICKGEIELAADDSFKWVEIKIDSEISTGKVFVVLDRNEFIEIAIAEDEFNGVFYLKKEINQINTFYDINTLEQKDFIWQAQEGIPCFKTIPEQNIYGAFNINNGFSRNYKLPNLWLSEVMSQEKEEFILINFQEAKKVSKVIITFDSNLNYMYDNLEIYKDFNAFPQLVKDYKVYAKKKDDYVEVLSVENNHQRVNTLTFNAIETNEIKLVFLNTNGSKRVGVYEVRVYE